MRRQRFQIIISLTSNELKQYYKPNYDDAWDIIKNYFDKNGFDALGKGIYITKKPIYFTELDSIVINLQEKYKWFDLNNPPKMVHRSTNLSPNKKLTTDKSIVSIC